MSTLQHKIVKIKKPRRCFGCQDRFEVGQEMIYHAGIFQGDFVSDYWCKPCDAYMTKYAADFDEGIMEGELRGERHYEIFKIEFNSSTAVERSVATTAQ